MVAVAQRRGSATRHLLVAAAERLFPATLAVVVLAVPMEQAKTAATMRVDRPALAVVVTVAELPAQRNPARRVALAVMALLGQVVPAVHLRTATAVLVVRVLVAAVAAALQAMVVLVATTTTTAVAAAAAVLAVV